MYKGKRFFTIHIADVGQEAYYDKYVRWLEQEVGRLRDELRNEQISSAQLINELQQGG